MARTTTAVRADRVLSGLGIAVGAVWAALALFGGLVRVGTADGVRTERGVDVLLGEASGNEPLLFAYGVGLVVALVLAVRFLRAGNDRALGALSALLVGFGVLGLMTVGLGFLLAGALLGAAALLGSLGDG